MAKKEQEQRVLFQVTELPGRPMLHWHGKRGQRGAAVGREKSE